MLVFPEEVLRGGSRTGTSCTCTAPAVSGCSPRSSRSSRRRCGPNGLPATCSNSRSSPPCTPWCARSVAASPSAARSIAAVIIIPPIGLTALAWVGGVALGLWAMVAALRGRFLLAGILGGFALLYRPDLVVAVGLGFAVLWPVLARASRKRMLGGLGIGLSPYLVHIVLAGPGHAFYGMVIQPVSNCARDAICRCRLRGATSTASCRRRAC